MEQGKFDVNYSYRHSTKKMYKILCRNLAYIDFDKGFCLHFQSEIALEPVFARYIARPFGKFCLREDDCVKKPQVCLQTSMPTDFCLVTDKIMLENPHTNILKTGSYT